MNQLSKKTSMSSREIALLARKQHKNVLQAIREMEYAWEKVTGLKFQLSEYADSTGRKLPMYVLGKSECLYVATKFNDEARARLILRWEELEEQQAPLRITSKRPAVSLYQPQSVQELTQNFRDLVYRELVKIPSQGTRVRVSGLVDFYTDMINNQMLES